MILVFDLDDTLYDETTYVKSSLQSVAKYLSVKLKIQQVNLYKDLIEVLETHGRGKIFDEVLKKHNFFSKTEVKNCIAIYRNNIPDIMLFDEAKDCLMRFKNSPKYLVTDGNKKVQSTKIKALGLNKYFKKTIPTHNFGLVNAKPSTYVFHKILQWEKALPQQLVYIGDNPKKDFISLKKEGFKTIRVLTGCFKNLRLTKEHEADYLIKSLDEIDSKLINTL